MQQEKRACDMLHFYYIMSPINITYHFSLLTTMYDM